MYRFNKENLATNDQVEKITLVMLLGGIWPLSLFMAEIVRRTLVTLWDFMDWVDDFINIDDNPRALTVPRHANLDRVTRTLKRTTRATIPDKEPPARKG